MHSLTARLALMQGQCHHTRRFHSGVREVTSGERSSSEGHMDGM